MAGGMAVLRGRLVELGEDGMLDYGEFDEDRANLPYNSTTHEGIEGEDGGDRLDPDEERRDAQLRRTIGADDATRVAGNAILLGFAMEMARRNDAKRRRVDSECEDLRQMCQDLRQKNADLQQRLDASERRRLELQEQR